MLKEVFLVAALAVIAVAQVESNCEYDWVKRDEFEGVRREMSRVNGALEAWQNTTAYTLQLLLRNSGERRKQCPCEELREDIINDTLKDLELLLELQKQQLLQLLTQQSSYPKGSIQNPAASCMEIAQSSSSSSGHYWLLTPSGRLQNVYCTPTTQCRQSVDGWMRVAYLDMTDPYQTCPQGFKQFNSPKRACGRTLNTGGCNSVTFPVHGVSYRKVCGRILGYHFGTPSGFYTPYYSENSIDGPYLEGVSVTYGQSPRKHIWSFANALQEAAGSYNGHICPCTNPASTMQQYIPNFVGNDYFCDAGTPTTGRVGVFYPDDPLWDGQGCGLQSTCCTFNNPPFFCKELPQDSTEDIEVRICADQDATSDEDSPIELIELYIQ